MEYPELKPKLKGVLRVPITHLGGEPVAFLNLPFLAAATKAVKDM
jgi:hypothetical protein